jgi:TPR repeat protein
LIKQRNILLTRAALSDVIMNKLMCYGDKYRLHNRKLIMCMISRRHFIGPCMDYPTKLFDEGKRLYSALRFEDAAKSWGKAALLQHPASHAFLASLLLEYRDLGLKDKSKIAFELAEAGMQLECPHSTGVYGHCVFYGKGTVSRVNRGTELIKMSATAGSCFGQYFLGSLYCNSIGGRYGLPNDYVEAVRLFRLSAEQGYSEAQTAMGDMYREGRGVVKDKTEAKRWWCLAAAQGELDARRQLLK